MEKILLEIAQSISSTLHLDKVLENILRESIKLIDVEAGSIFLVDHETHELHFKIVKGDKASVLKDLNVKFKLNEGIIGVAIQTGRVVVVNNAQEDARLKKDIDWLTGFTTKSVMAVPMMIKGKSVGAIELINKKSGEFTENDTGIISAVASQSAIAIENARLYEEIYAIKEYMDDIFESMPGGFIAVDSKGKIKTVNPRASEILNIPKELVGENYSSAFLRFSEIVELFKVTLTRGESQIRREMELTVGNKRKTIGYSTLIIKNAKGTPKGAGMIFQDITSLKNKA